MNDKTNDCNECEKHRNQKESGGRGDSRESEKNSFPGIDTSRRDFLYRVGAAAISVTAVGSGAVTLDFLWPDVVKQPPVRVKVGRPTDYPTNSVTLFSDQRFFVIRAVEGYFYAMSAICPHLGCLTKWWDDFGEVRCPCHGSRFSKTGELLRGPSPRGLYQLEMEMSPREELIVMNNARAKLDELKILKV